jgi:hypothetical protein
MLSRDVVERQESVAILDRAIDGLPAALRRRASDDEDALRLVASRADAFKTLV